MSVDIPPPGTYTLEPDASIVKVKAKHIYGLGTVKGSFSVANGKITVAAPPEDSTVELAIDAASFSSGSRARDKAVASADFLDAANHPHIAFSGAGASIQDGIWTVAGHITARAAVAASTVSVVSSAVDGDHFDVLVTTRVDRFAHGITAHKGMAGRYINIEAKARARRVD